MVHRAQPHTHFPLRDLGVLNFPNNHGGPELPEKFWKAEHMDGLAQEIHFLFLCSLIPLLGPNFAVGYSVLMEFKGCCMLCGNAIVYNF